MRTAWLAALCLVAGCKTHHHRDLNANEVGSGLGSATGSGSAGSGSAAPAKTIAELEKRYEECWGFWGDARFEQFKGCYTTDAVQDAPGTEQQLKTPEAIISQMRDERGAFPDEKAQLQLVLVSGKTAIGIALVTGTNNGSMRSPRGTQPGTNKKIGYYLGMVSELDDQGRAAHEWVFYDNATVLAQLGHSDLAPSVGLARPVADKAAAKEVAIAKDDATEKANVAAIGRLVLAYNKHDLAAIGELVADDVTWSEIAMDKDWNKQALIANLGQLWRGFTGIKLDVGRSTVWAAGDYVAQIETMTGWNDGDLPAFKIKKTGKLLSLPALAVYKLAKGKVERAWVFYQQLAIMQQVGELPTSAIGSGSGSGSGSATPAGPGSAAKPDTGSGSGSAGSGSAAK